VSADIGVYWPGCTSEEEYGHYGFDNDTTSWANWIVEAVSTESVRSAVIELGCEALLSHTTEGVSDADVEWTTPDALVAAARRMAAFIANKDPRTRAILAAYRKGVIGEDPPDVEIDRDLRDVMLLGKYAKEHGARTMTISVKW